MGTTKITEIEEKEIEKKEKLEAISKDVKSMKEEASSIVIKTEEDFGNANKILGKVKSRMKRIEDVRKYIVTPLNNLVKEHNNDFRIHLDTLKVLEKGLKEGIGKYQDIQELKREEEARIAREAAEEEERKKQEEIDRKKKELEEADEKTKEKIEEEIKEIEEEEVEVKEVLAPQKTVRTSAGTTSFKKVWKHEIIDMEKVPGKYWVVDESLIRKAIADGTREIEGVNIFQKTEVSVR